MNLDPDINLLQNQIIRQLQRHVHGDHNPFYEACRLNELMRDAPGEWRPVPENSSFLGFFRFKEWMS